MNNNVSTTEELIHNESTEDQPNWKDLQFGKTPLIDVHAHPSLKATLFKHALTTSFAARRTFNPFSVRTDFEKLKKGGVDVLLSSTTAPEKDIVDDCRILKLLGVFMPITYRKLFGNGYFGVTVDMMKRMEGEVEKSPDAKMAKTKGELDAILKQDKGRPVAIVHSIEGAHSLDRDLGNLAEFHKMGVAYLTLAHFYRNDAVHPVYPYPEYAQKLGCFKSGRDLTLGLTDFGEQVIEKMVELKMILDVAHCTPIARHQIFEIVGNQIPIIASHVGAYEINPSPYNMKDWEIKRIAETGGLVGVIFMNFWLMPNETKRGLKFIARTIDHFIKVGGIEHVAIGTDFDGLTDPPDDVKDASELPNVTKRLIAEGYSPEEIRKILGTNALRVIRKGLKP